MKPTILIDTSPLETAHSVRGIGTYTRFLTEYLEKLNKFEIIRSGTTQAAQVKPDLVHYPYFDLFFSTLPILSRQKTVVTVHDVIPLKFPKYYRPGFKGKLKFIKQKQALQTVKAVITDSESSKKDITALLKIDPENTHVVYLAANPDLKKPTPKEIDRVRRIYKLPQSYILYVGDINYNKNLPQLIKAVRYLPSNIKLVCLGKNFKEQDIPEWQWIETQMALSDVEKRVKFISQVLSNANEDLSAIYSGALCYVQPSLYEGFGLPVLEAMRCQTPVISAQNSSLTEIGGSHVRFTQTDAQSLAEGINQVLNLSSEKTRAMVKAASDWSQGFTWEKTAKKTAEVYQKVLSE